MPGCSLQAGRESAPVVRLAVMRRGFAALVGVVCQAHIRHMKAAAWRGGVARRVYRQPHETCTAHGDVTEGCQGDERAARNAMLQ